jgi:malonate-semialdehyde dehydrogenase (acetylating)/methylmalonate-semialdehyde dehydrogenase
VNLVGHWISGRTIDAVPERVGDVYNPATGERVRQVAFASAADVDRAVAAAGETFPEWSATPVVKRARIMFTFAELLRENSDEVAATITSEHGKTLADALGEVARGLEVVEFACGIPHLLKGDYSENVARGIDTHSLRQPLGVVAGITPFNFPAMVPLWMFPIALACGNTFVLKPSEKDPSTANLLAQMLQGAGLPDGALNVIHGDKVAVDGLLMHPDVAAVSSVGSTPVARYIYETAARHGKRVQALGGAKNHMVVLEDADLETAADAIVGAAYGSAGERCMAISAVVAVGAAGDALIPRLQARLEGLKVGPGDQEGVEMGPLVTGEHRDKVASYVETGLNEGAELVVDGRSLVNEDGFFLGPCLFDKVTPEMSIYTDEIFGPILGIVRAETFEDALRIVNANEYGNGTSVFTRDGGAARRFTSGVEAGMVGVNVPIPVPMAFFSFGGWKSSLFGDSNVHGEEGVRFYTRLKTVTARWPEEATGADLGFPTNH